MAGRNKNKAKEGLHYIKSLKEVVKIQKSHNRLKDLNNKPVILSVREKNGRVRKNYVGIFIHKEYNENKQYYIIVYNYLTQKTYKINITNEKGSIRSEYILKPIQEGVGFIIPGFNDSNLNITASTQKIINNSVPTNSDKDLHISRNGKTFSIDGSNSNYEKMGDSHLISTVKLFIKNRVTNSKNTEVYVKELINRNLHHQIPDLKKYYERVFHEYIVPF